MTYRASRHPCKGHTVSTVFEPFGGIRRRIIRDLIMSSAPADKVITDLGAGDPAVTDGIACMRQIKIDMNAKARPHVVCDLTEGIPLPDNSVDICVASEILEHLYASRAFLREVKRTLKDGGSIILSSPNICSAKYRAAFLMGRIPAHAAKGDCTYQDERPGHVRDYSFPELRALLGEFDFATLWEGSDGLSLNGRTIIPQWLVPKTLGDSIIIKAAISK